MTNEPGLSARFAARDRARASADLQRPISSEALPPRRMQAEAFRSAAQAAINLAVECEADALKCEALDAGWSAYQRAEAKRHRQRAEDHLFRATLREREIIQ